MGGKRVRTESEYSDGVSSDSGSDAPSENLSQTSVAMDFATFNMSPSDAGAVRQFLLGAFALAVRDAPDVPMTALAEVIACGLSAYMGTTGKQGEEDEGALAISALVPFDCSAVAEVAAVEDGQDAVEALAALVHASVPKGHKAALGALDSDKLALLLHERYVNVPSEVAGPMLRQLLDDLSAAREECAAFDISAVVLATPVYRERAPQDQAYDTRGEHDDAPEDWQYYYDEMHIAEGLASASWDVAVRSTHETADSRRAFSDRGAEVARRFLVLPMEAVAEFVSLCEAAAAS